MEKLERFCCESNVTKKQLLKEINEILDSNVYKNYKVWMYEKNENINIKIKEIKTKFNLNEVEDMAKFLEYNLDKKENEIKYCLNLKDSFCVNILSLSYIFFQKHFI